MKCDLFFLVWLQEKNKAKDKLKVKIYYHSNINRELVKMLCSKEYSFEDLNRF